MAREFTRRDRVGEALGRELSDLVTTEVKDPRVSLAAVTDVDVSPDLKHAKVFVSSFDVASEHDAGPEIVAGLESARGFLKKELGKRLRLRVIPELVFVHDTTERDAQVMDRLIDSAVAEDQNNDSSEDDRG